MKIEVEFNYLQMIIQFVFIFADFNLLCSPTDRHARIVNNLQIKSILLSPISPSNSPPIVVLCKEERAKERERFSVPVTKSHRLVVESKRSTLLYTLLVGDEDTQLLSSFSGASFPATDHLYGHNNNE